MTNPPDFHKHRKEAITDVASELPHAHLPADLEDERRLPHPLDPVPADPYEPGDERKLPQMSFMDTPEAVRGVLHPEEHAELVEQVRQILLSHLELERSVAHIKYLQQFDKIRIESLATDFQKQKKREDPKFIRLIAIYLPFGFACMLFILEEFIRHVSK
jgi:hypothetical protein